MIGERVLREFGNPPGQREVAALTALKLASTLGEG